MGMGAASCPLPLGGQHKVPTQTDQAEKEAHCEVSPATVFSILKTVTSSQDSSHPPNIFPAKDYMS